MRVVDHKKTLNYLTEIFGAEDVVGFPSHDPRRSEVVF